MRRSIVTVAILLAMVAVSVVPPTSAQEEDGPQPVIFLPELRYDFGESFEKETYEHDFVVRNTGKADLVIEKVKPG